MSWATFLKPLCAPCCQRIDRVRPRIPKSKECGSFLDDEFVGGFDDHAQWIAQFTRIFLIGVKNPPKLVAGLVNHGPARASSSPQPFGVVVYQLHARDEVVAMMVRYEK
jgi:hypothetical protein